TTAAARLATAAARLATTAAARLATTAAARLATTAAARLATTAAEPIDVDGLPDERKSIWVAKSRRVLEVVFEESGRWAPILGGAPSRTV
ncbi:MAG TPA: hypothetical protein VGZ68_04505, partial [Acidimicrobiales bacterium]|nr:hypothetical protein [Acidimicrobiales bacterium]